MTVLLGYLHPNHLSASFQRCLQELVMRDQATNRNLSQWAAIRTEGPAIPEARNTLARQTLAGDDEWLFMIDADMGFHPDTLDRLLAEADPTERPVVGGLCFAYREVGEDGMNGFLRIPQPTIFDYIEHPDGHHRFTGRNHYPVNTLLRVAATGGACLLIHRTVLEKMEAEYGEAWFNRIPSVDGLMGEDISFCSRLGALEIPIHVHTGIRTTHHKELWVGEPQFWETMLPPPATEECVVVVPAMKDRITGLPRLLESLKASTGLAWPLILTEDEEHTQAVFDYDPEVLTVEVAGTFSHRVNTAWKWLEDFDEVPPWVKIVGDDVIFHPGWLNHSQHIATLYGAQVVGSNDIANQSVIAGEHATHWMIASDYIRDQGASWDGPGIIAHEGYHHWFIDNELVTVAKQRGVFQVALGAIVEHLHPIVGKAGDDDTYRLGRQRVKQDQKLFLRRVGENAAAGVLM